jgi:hypothetical protein
MLLKPALQQQRNPFPQADKMGDCNESPPLVETRNFPTGNRGAGQPASVRPQTASDLRPEARPQAFGRVKIIKNLIFVKRG